MFNFKNKTVFVTGGAVRIGREVSRGFAEKGANVIIGCNRSKYEAEKLLIELNSLNPGKHKIVSGNLTDSKFIDEVFRNNRIDILINNASVFDNRRIEEENTVDAKSQFDINFWVPFSLMKKFRDQSGIKGNIINFLDYRVRLNDMDSGSYVISKRALRDLTELTALQWAPEIRVNGIALGFVLPPVWLSESKMKKSKAKTPLKDIVGLEEVLKTCFYLIENRNITGEILYLDGGLHL